VDEYQTTLGDDFDAGRKTLGEVLKTARLAKGLELTDIARETRIHLRNLNAIESDQHETLPALPFTLGFVKSFARVVGIDPEAASAQFRAETSKTSHVPQPMAQIEPLDEARVPSRGLVVGAGLALVVLVGGGLAWQQGFFSPSPPPPPVEVEAVQPAPMPEPLPVAPTVATDPTLAAPDTPVASDPLAEPGSVPAAPVTGPVVISASEDAWFKVYAPAGGPTVKMGILRAGETYTVPEGQGDLLLWTGKAGALTLSVGGRPLAPLGRPDETVKDVSLAPAALAARIR
jgi:cytoskeletal protein RodZ